jgi:hypothetical protein
MTPCSLPSPERDTTMTPFRCETPTISCHFKILASTIVGGWAPGKSSAMEYYTGRRQHPFYWCDLDGAIAMCYWLGLATPPKIKLADALLMVESDPSDKHPHVRQMRKQGFLVCRTVHAREVITA